MKNVLFLSVMLLLIICANAQTRTVADTTVKSNWRCRMPASGVVYYIDGVRLTNLGIGSPGLGKFFTQPDGTVIIRKDQLLVLPQRNINSIAGLIIGVDSRAGEVPNIRGARQDGTAYYIDGIRTREPELMLP